MAFIKRGIHKIFQRGGQGQPSVHRPHVCTGKGAYRHGYVEGLAQQPTFHWARANGWAILTNCELLDALPEDHPDRPFLLEQLRRHIKGLGGLPKFGRFLAPALWTAAIPTEKLRPRPFMYCIAHAINKGWIEGITYGPVAQLGWHAVSTQIKEGGQVWTHCSVECREWDSILRSTAPSGQLSGRPRLRSRHLGRCGNDTLKLGHWHPRTNDSGLHYYKVSKPTPSPLFYLTEDMGKEAVNKQLLHRPYVPGVKKTVFEDSIRHGSITCVCGKPVGRAPVPPPGVR